MKLEAVLRRVVKAALRAEGVGEVVREAGVARDLLAHLEHRLELFLELVRLLQAALGHERPRLLAQRAVRLLQVAPHLHERLLLAPEVHRQRAGELLVLLAEPGFLRLQRDILLTEQLDEQRGVAVEDLVTTLVELRAKRVREEQFREVELPGFQLRLDLLDELEVGRLRLRAVRVAGHRDVALAALLIERGGKLALVENPLLELGERGALRPARVKLVEERGNLAPVAEVNLSGHKAARGMGGKVRERQQIHGGREWRKRREHRSEFCRQPLKSVRSNAASPSPSRRC